MLRLLVDIQDSSVLTYYICNILGKNNEFKFNSNDYSIIANKTSVDTLSYNKARCLPKKLDQISNL